MISGPIRFTRGKLSIGEFGAKIEGVLRRSWLLWCVGILAYSATVYLGRNSTIAGVSLEADMQISAGQFITSYTNDTRIPPKFITIVPNVRQIYRVERLPGTLKYLRIDPTNVGGARIAIFSVAVVSGGQVVRKFSPNELRSWPLYHLAEVQGDPAALNLVSDDPKTTWLGDFLGTNVDIIASQYPDWLMSVFDAVRRPDFFPLVFVSCFLLFLLAGITTARGAIEAAIVLAVAALAHPLVALFSHVPVPFPRVSAAVGYVGYTGYPKLRDHLISIALLVMCATIAWLASRYIHWPALDTQKTTPPETGKQWTSVVISSAVVLGLVTISYPNLSVQMQILKRTVASLGWDDGNFALWDYLIRHGYLPFRDFWYPYGGLFALSLPLPTGAYLVWIETTLALGFLYLGLRYAIRRNGMALVVFLAVFLPCWLYEFVGWPRYIWAIDVALLYVAIQDARVIQWRKCLAFAGLSALVFFYEPVQLLYAGTGIAAHTLFVSWSVVASRLDHKDTRARLLELFRQRMLSVVVPLLIGILPVVVWLASQGMLPGFLRFQMSLGDLATYTAIPAPIAQWTLPALHADSMFMVLFFALVLGLYVWFRYRGHTDPAMVASMVVAFAGFMVMQKQITRHPMMAQTQIYPYLCVVLYVVGVFPKKTKAQSVVIVLFLAFVAGVGEYRNGFQILVQTEKDLPATLAGNWDLLLHHNAEIRATNATLDERGRYAALSSELAVISVLEHELGWRSPQPVYVLGDDPIFYRLLPAAPPYCPNNYNCSPISEQERSLQWLREHRPHYVVWDPRKSAFDEVPSVVRVPLIYQYVAENYRGLMAVGPYWILVSASERSGADPEFWRQQLGPKIDLGHIPELTRLSDYQDCPPSDTTRCQQVMFVRFPSGRAAGKARMTIDSPSGQLEVAFDVAVGSRTYLIDLDRLWFRTLLGSTWRVNASPAGAEVRKELRLRKSGVLY